MSLMDVGNWGLINVVFVFFFSLMLYECLFLYIEYI